LTADLRAGNAATPIPPHPTGARHAASCRSAIGLAATLAHAQAIQLPPRKPGQWEARVATEKPPGGVNLTAQMCVDANTDRDLLEFGLRLSKDSCTRYDIKRVGANYVIDAACTFGSVKSVTKTTISGDFQSTVTVRSEGTTEGVPGAASGPQPVLIVQTSRWTAAACADGMKPGDIALGGGLKFNVKQMRQLGDLLGKIQIK
jgi:hypothetical protein